MRPHTCSVALFFSCLPALISLTGCEEEGLKDDSTVDSGTAPVYGRSVLILVMDGVRVQEFTSPGASDITGQTGEQMAVKTWATLGRDGTVVRATVNPGVTNTASSHAALFTGRFQPYGTVAQNPELTLYHPELPTLFEESVAQLGLAPEQVRLVVNTELLRDSAISLYPGLDLADPIQVIMEGNKPSTDDLSVFAELKDVISAAHPRLLVANIHDVDRQGHNGARGDYPGGVRDIDAYIAEFYGWLQAEEPAWLESTLILLTTDHGRHSVPLEGVEVSWYEHGDDCRGCREQPLFAVGAGVAPGEIVAGRYLQEDVTATAAAWLGVEMPWSGGIALDFVEAPLQPLRSGRTAVSAAGDLVVSQEYGATLDQRSRIVAALGGAEEVLSAPEAVDVGDVVAAQWPDGQAAVCWREWSPDEEEDEWPWRPACVRGGPVAWTELAFPEDHPLGPVWAPVLVATNDPADGAARLYALWIDNQNSATTAGQTEAPIGAQIASWTEAGGWSPVQSLDGFFPTAPALAVSGDQFLMAVAVATDQAHARLTREIAVWTGDGPATRIDGAEALTAGQRRLERPAVRLEGVAAALAALGWDEDGAELLYAESGDAGRTWGAAAAIPAGGAVLPNVSPQFAGGFLYRAVLGDDGEALLCRSAGAEQPVCQAAGSARIASFSADAAGAWASVDAGIGQWEIRRIGW